MLNHVWIAASGMIGINIPRTFAIGLFTAPTGTGGRWPAPPETRAFMPVGAMRRLYGLLLLQPANARAHADGRRGPRAPSSPVSSRAGRPCP